MKKILAVLLLTVSVGAFAQHRPYPHHGHGHGGWGWWVAPVVTGVIGYEIARSQQPVIVQQPPVVVQQPSVVYVPQGMPPPPVGYHYEQINDANCHCLRWVLVQG